MCPRGEIGRHKGLKTLPFWSASSSLAEGTKLKSHENFFLHLIKL